MNNSTGWGLGRGMKVYGMENSIPVQIPFPQPPAETSGNSDLSVNQVNAQIKLTEMWKAVHTVGYPLNIQESTCPEGSAITRSQGSHHLVQHGMNELSSRTFINDATRVWNQAPKVVKMAETIYSAKKEIKKFVKTLPI